MRNRLVALLVVLSLGALAAPAQAGTTLNLLAGTEFGRGVGAGLELGGTDTFVVGAGVALGAGYSSSDGFVSSLAPGMAVGYRHYVSGWFLGPSIGINYEAASTEGAVHHPSAWTTSALLDLGYRWEWKDSLGWNTRLGLGGGVAWGPSQALEPSIALTISVGLPL